VLDELGALADRLGDLRDRRVLLGKLEVFCAVVDDLRRPQEPAQLVRALHDAVELGEELRVFEHRQLMGSGTSAAEGKISTVAAEVTPWRSRHSVLRIEMSAISSCASSGSRVVIFWSHRPGAATARAQACFS